MLEAMKEGDAEGEGEGGAEVEVGDLGGIRGHIPEDDRADIFDGEEDGVKAEDLPEGGDLLDLEGAEEDPAGPENDLGKDGGELLDIAEEDAEGADEVSDAEGEEENGQEDDGEEEDGGVEDGADKSAHSEPEGGIDEEFKAGSGDEGEGEDGHGEADLFDEVAILLEEAGGAGEGFVDEIDDGKTDVDADGVADGGFVFYAPEATAEEKSKDDEVESHTEERADNEPEEAEGAGAGGFLNLPDDELAEQRQDIA